MRTLVLALLTLTTLTGCGSSLNDTAVERLKEPAAAHAAALAGDDVPAMRSTGRALLAGLEAYAGWRFIRR